MYGPENVTSGASSDLEQASRIARALVKVGHYNLYACPAQKQSLTSLLWRTLLAHQRYGYSDKIGPVAFTDRDEVISPKKLDEIEAEVRGYVLVYSTARPSACAAP